MYATDHVVTMISSPLRLVVVDINQDGLSDAIIPYAGSLMGPPRNWRECRTVLPPATVSCKSAVAISYQDAPSAERHVEAAAALDVVEINLCRRDCSRPKRLR
jgi:hypothetical protein